MPAVLAGGAASMTLGFETNLSLRVLISSDRVAEKNSVWRSGGSRPTMRSYPVCPYRASVGLVDDEIFIRQQHLAALEMVGSRPSGDQRIDPLSSRVLVGFDPADRSAIDSLSRCGRREVGHLGGKLAGQGGSALKARLGASRNGFRSSKGEEAVCPSRLRGPENVAPSEHRGWIFPDRSGRCIPDRIPPG